MSARTSKDDPNDPRVGRHAETCTLCDRKSAACKPSRSRFRLCSACAPRGLPGLAGCKRCALKALPDLIAQAVVGGALPGLTWEAGAAELDALMKNYRDAAAGKAARCGAVANAPPGLAVCKRCALAVLPGLIAEAVLAGAGPGRAARDGLAAADAVEQNYIDAVLHHASLYNGGDTWVPQPDPLEREADERYEAEMEAWIEYDLGRGPLPEPPPAGASGSVWDWDADWDDALDDA